MGCSGARPSGCSGAIVISTSAKACLASLATVRPASPEVPVMGAVMISDRPELTVADGAIMGAVMISDRPELTVAGGAIMGAVVISDRPELIVAGGAIMGAVMISIRPVSNTHRGVFAPFLISPADFVWLIGAAPTLKSTSGSIPALCPASLPATAHSIPDRLELFKGHGSIAVFVDLVES